jgi:hypothetical protein
MRLADSSTRCVVILHPGKYLGIITGISLASVLMIQQLGILENSKKEILNLS